MVNGYVTIPKSIVEHINSSSSIEDPIMVATMDELVSLGKPIYIDGLILGQYTVSAQLSTAKDAGGWFLGYSLTLTFPAETTLEFSMSYSAAENKIIAFKGGVE